MFSLTSPKAFLIICGSVVFALGFCRSVFAHPHMWIDLKTEVIFEEGAHIAGIHQEWLFDDFYSTALLEDAAKHPDGLEQGLNAEISEIISGLHAWNYFTQITVDTEKIKAKPVQHFDTEVRGNRVWVRFTTELDRPANAATQTFTYSIFDPTYYIEMYHFEEAVVGFRGVPPKGCRSEIRQADPSSEAISLSQSPVLDTQPDMSVGELFAETVTVHCR